MAEEEGVGGVYAQTGTEDLVVNIQAGGNLGGAVQVELCDGGPEEVDGAARVGECDVELMADEGGSTRVL